MKASDPWTFDDDWDSEEEKAQALEFLSDSRFRRLTHSQQGLLIKVLKTPGSQELDLLKRIWGRTPSQAVHSIAQEFADRFGRSSEVYVRYVVGRLSPSHSWMELDSKMTAFARGLFPGLDRYRVIDFWDRMRYLIEALPQRNRGKKSGSQAETARVSLKLKKPKFGWWDYRDCALCWRTVPVNPGTMRRGKVLCFEHDLSPNDPLYRKHNRLMPLVASMAWKLKAHLREIYPRSVNEGQNLKLYRELNLIHLLNPQSPLKNLVEYMAGQLRGYDRAATKKDEWEVLLEMFHGPFPKGLDPLYREAMDVYIHNRAFFEPFVDIRQLAQAEAWLTALKIDRRRKTGQR